MVRKPSSYQMFIAALLVLLVFAVALFVYGSVTNGMVRPQLPGKGVFAMEAMRCHG